MSRFLLLTVLCLFCASAMAQDFPYGELDKPDLEMKMYDKDTSAHALVLNEYGNGRIEARNDYTRPLVYDYHVKIKIFDPKGFNNGEIELPYTTGDEIENVSGLTTYTDDNGIIKSTGLDEKKIYRTEENKNFYVLKFAMPALRKGCIVEYRFRFISHHIDYFHPWLFQGLIPKLRSVYEINIPAYWHYNASMRGDLKLKRDTGYVDQGCFIMGGVKTDCSHHIYEMDNVPAFVIEDYMTSPKNFLSGMYFQLTDYRSFSIGTSRRFNGSILKVANDWKIIDYDLKHSDYFGDQMKRKGLFKDKISLLIAGKTDTLEKAKAIYAYIQKAIKWNEDNSPESYYGISKTIDNHIGNSGDINLSLIAALGAAGLKADAVLLSTRDHGSINRLYPSYADFNYVIAKIDISGTSYFLDATDQLLPFGILPFKCLNDQGRVISLDKPSYWTDINTGQKESDSYNLDLTLQKDGKITGTMSVYSGSYQGYLRRKKIKKFNSIDEYLDNQQDISSKFKILKTEIGNLDSLDLPLSETYQVEIKASNDFKADRITFNPVFLDSYSVNPLKLAKRTYPVDYGMPSTRRFTLSLHLPEGYTVDELPKDIGLTLPGDGGKFISNFQNNDNTLTFSRIIQLNKSVYMPGEYLYLKEFYNKIILSQNLEVKFKRKI